MAATNQRTNKVELVAGTRLVNFQASAATLLSADLLRTQTELPGKLGRASAIYINKISMNGADLNNLLSMFLYSIFIDFRLSHPENLCFPSFFKFVNHLQECWN
jgi:hypothetical protein